MRGYFTLHRSVFPSYLTIESGRMKFMLVCELKETDTDRLIPTHHAPHLVSS